MEETSALAGTRNRLRMINTGDVAYVQRELPGGTGELPVDHFNPPPGKAVGGGV